MAIMNKFFNGRSLELLAPAGTFDIYKTIIDSKCDAVYCGGEVLNMRLIRKGYNLSNEELKEAVYLANERDKKVYITVNSLLDPSELSQAEEYLSFLEEIQPHGLIIQDAAVLDLVKRKKLNLTLHGSVMMNIHNLDMIRFFEKQGVSRVVLSREMSLKDIRELSARTDMELEYFTHGDMCVAHGAQCLYSSWLFGMSGSRGRCLKPCRWPYSRLGTDEDKPFPLAVKDLSMYSYLSDMILAGVSSFKIEGRMREKEFIASLVNTYGEALERFLDDPYGASHGDPEDMEPFKKRDYSTGYAFGTPGIKNINTRGEGSGKFYSTGKMFSTPTREREINGEESLPAGSPSDSVPLEMAVKVNSPDQGRLALEYGARRIYLSAEPFAPDLPVSRKDLAELADQCGQAGADLYFSLPRMMSAQQSDLFRAYFSRPLPVKGVLAGQAGVLEFLKSSEYSLVCDTPMNLYNARAIRFYADQGFQGWTPSLELPFDSLLSLPEDLKALGCEARGEVVLHGLPTVMYMDHDVSRRQEDRVELDTPESRLTIRRDWWNRYHLLPHKELSLLPRLPELVSAGYSRFRLELQGYGPAESREVLRACGESLADPASGGGILKNLKPIGGGFTYGAHHF